MSTNPYDVRMPGEIAENNTFVVRKPRNKVHIPDALEGAKSNHVFARTVDENGQQGMGYVPVPYERSENDFPKMMFHPDWHKVPAPIHNDFKELGAYNKAVTDWKEKYERFQMAQNEEDVERLSKKGWKDTPPVVKVPKTASNSEEV